MGPPTNVDGEILHTIEVQTTFQASMGPPTNVDGETTRSILTQEA